MTDDPWVDSVRGSLEHCFDTRPIEVGDVLVEGSAEYYGLELDAMNSIVGKTWLEVANAGPIPVLGALWWGATISGRQKIIAAGALSVCIWGPCENWDYLGCLESGFCGGDIYPPSLYGHEDLLNAVQRDTLSSAFAEALNVYRAVADSASLRSLEHLSQCIK